MGEVRDLEPVVDVVRPGAVGLLGRDQPGGRASRGLGRGRIVGGAVPGDQAVQDLAGVEHRRRGPVLVDAGTRERAARQLDPEQERDRPASAVDVRRPAAVSVRTAADPGLRQREVRRHDVAGRLRVRGRPPTVEAVSPADAAVDRGVLGPAQPRGGGLEMGSGGRDARGWVLTSRSRAPRGGDEVSRHRGRPCPAGPSQGRRPTDPAQGKTRVPRSEPSLAAPAAGLPGRTRRSVPISGMPGVATAEWTPSVVAARQPAKSSSSVSMTNGTPWIARRS